MKKNLLFIRNLISHQFFLLILISIIFFSYIYFFANINGEWRHFIDSEILWPYNILLILSGEIIEFNAYGFLYFILEYNFFNILNFLNLLKTETINDLNNSSNFSEKLENLVFAGRWFNVLIIYSSLITAFFIFKSLSNNLIFSFILVLIFMLTPGMIQQISHARVDILASTLIFISFFYLTKFAENKNELSYFLFIIFFFLSVLAKVQSYLFLATLLISSIYFISSTCKLEKNSKYKLWLNILLVIFILYCTIYPIIFHRHAKFSLLFLFCQLFFLNIYFYFLFKNLRNTVGKNIFYTAITFLVIILFILFLKNISYMSMHAIRISFFEPMEIRMYLSEQNLKGTDVITLDINKNFSYFYLLFQNLTIGFISSFFVVFKELNSNALLIILNLTIIFYYFFLKKIKKDILLIFPILSFFIINGINSIRHQGFELYLTYSEFLLYIPICIFIKKKNKLLNKCLCLLLLVILILPISLNPRQFNEFRFLKSDNFKVWCPGFTDVYTQKISRKKIIEICN